MCVTGEDAQLKQMLWVVENLQEELFRAQEYRLQAERRQQQHRLTISGLQVRLFCGFLTSLFRQLCKPGMQITQCSLFLDISGEAPLGCLTHMLHTCAA